jgi:hypothetical protein
MTLFSLPDFTIPEIKIADIPVHDLFIPMSICLYCPQNDVWYMNEPEIKEMLADLIWLNALIATELIQVTENTSAILRNSPPPQSCLAEHHALRQTALSMAEKYRPETVLGQHLGKHQ